MGPNPHRGRRGGRRWRHSPACAAFGVRTLAEGGEGTHLAPAAASKEVKPSDVRKRCTATLRHEGRGGFGPDGICVMKRRRREGGRLRSIKIASECQRRRGDTQWQSKQPITLKNQSRENPHGECGQKKVLLPPPINHRRNDMHPPRRNLCSGAAVRIRRS